MIETTRRGKRLAAFLAAALGCGLWLLAEAAPAEAQASRTRPGGGGGSSASSSSGGGSSSSSGGSASSSSGGGSSSRGRPSVQRTRPPEGSSGGAPTVIDERRDPPPRPGGSGGHFHHGHRGFHGFYGWPWYGYRYPYWSPYPWGWWLGWSWWYPSWDYGYGYGGYPYPPYGGRVYPHGGPSMGALDTDVWPARTEVWIDGRYVGFVDQFDGFPRFLWLEKGTYDVAFYYQGFKTLARQYTIHPGLVIDVEDRLEPGEAIHPSALAPTETPRRDARIRSERERRAGAGEPEWRRRVREDRERARERAGDADEGAYEESEPTDADGREATADRGWLFLGVTPDDAAVYLDGDFLGMAGELSRRGGGLEVAPGRHELSVVHPDHRPHKVEFEVEAGGEKVLEVALDEA